MSIVMVDLHLINCIHHVCSVCFYIFLLSSYMQALISLAKKIKDSKEHKNRVGWTFFKNGFAVQHYLF